MDMLTQGVRQREEEHTGEEVESDQIIGEGERTVQRVTHEHVGHHQQHDHEHEHHRDHRQRAFQRAEHISCPFDHL
ncbi:G3E family GTPase [Bradyrhizobium sp. i1.3.1]